MVVGHSIEARGVAGEHLIEVQVVHLIEARAEVEEVRCLWLGEEVPGEMTRGEVVEEQVLMRQKGVKNWVVEVELEKSAPRVFLEAMEEEIHLWVGRHEHEIAESPLKGEVVEPRLDLVWEVVLYFFVP